jgi:hypothetical protein
MYLSNLDVIKNEKAVGWLIRVTYENEKYLRYAAFSLPGPSARRDQTLEGVIEDLRRAANVLEEDLDYCSH